MTPSFFIFRPLDKSNAYGSILAKSNQRCDAVWFNTRPRATVPVVRLFTRGPPLKRARPLFSSSVQEETAIGREKWK